MFDHTHNLFTHAAVELGLPGLILWLAVWLRCFVIAVRERATFGSALLGMWFSAPLRCYSMARIFGIRLARNGS